MRLIFEEHYGEYKLKKLKKSLSQNFGIYQAYLRNLNRLISELPIVVIPAPSDLTDIMEKYSLLPNDACKVHGIATFDSDFENVEKLP